MKNEVMIEMKSAWMMQRKQHNNESTEWRCDPSERV